MLSGAPIRLGEYFRIMTDRVKLNKFFNLTEGEINVLEQKGGASYAGHIARDK